MVWSNVGIGNIVVGGSGTSGSISVYNAAGQLLITIDSNGFTVYDPATGDQTGFWNSNIFQILYTNVLFQYLQLIMNANVATLQSLLDNVQTTKPYVAMTLVAAHQTTTDLNSGSYTRGAGIIAYSDDQAATVAESVQLYTDTGAKMGIWNGNLGYAGDYPNLPTATPAGFQLVCNVPWQAEVPSGAGSGTVETWHQPSSFPAGFSSNATVPFAYRLMPDGTVMCRGRIDANAAIAANTTCFTFPTHYVSTTLCSFIISQIAATTLQKAVVTTGGLLQIGIATGAAATFAFDGVRFSVI